MVKLRWVMCVGLAFMCVFGCAFIVKNSQQDVDILDEHLFKAKKTLIENTSWKLDTQSMFVMFDGNADGRLNENELNAMLLVAAMEKAEAEATAGTLVVVGDADGDDQLTETEFRQMFGIKNH